MILLIGGLAMQSSELKPLQAALKNEGLDSVFFDNLCVGLGPRPSDKLTIEAQARHQWQSLDAAGITGAIDIWGISMGGMIASTMAAMQPERIRQLMVSATSANVAGNPAMSPELFSSWINARDAKDLERAVWIGFGPTTLAEHPEIEKEYFRYRLSRENKQSGPDFVAQMYSIRDFPGEKIYSAVNASKVSATVMVGDEDQLFTETQAQDLYRLLPNSQRVILPKTGHMLHLENLPGLTRAIVGIVK